VNYKSNEVAATGSIQELVLLGVNACAIQADVSNESEVVNPFNQMDEQLGKVTALVNNAGILLPQIRVEHITAARINQIFTTNVTDYFLCCREAIKHMSTKYDGKGGSIVNVSSVASRLGAPNEYIDYAASKGAIDTLTKNNVGVSDKKIIKNYS